MSLATYSCTNCKKTRRFKFVDEDHQALVEQSKNGLVTYSDIHTCVDGLTSVNNLSVDTNYNIRGFEQIELPKYRISTGGIPLPDKGYNLILITQAPQNLEIHVLIRDQMTQTNIKIGRFDHQFFIPITTLQSDMGLIEMDVFPTGTAYTPIIEQWLQELVSIMEVLPPTTLGSLIDTLNYISNNIQNQPSPFDVKFMKTIFASHEVHFILENADSVNQLKEKYGGVITENDYENIDRFVRILAGNEMSSIKNFTSNPRIDMDIISLIYLFHILEDEGIISIERPGIMDV